MVGGQKSNYSRYCVSSTIFCNGYDVIILLPDTTFSWINTKNPLTLWECVTYNRYMTKKTTDKKQAEHYVNNKEFTAAVAEYNASVKLAESQGKTQST